MECFPHGGFRSPADFRSSVTSILRMMRDDLSAGVGFSPERVIPYNPFDGIEEEEERDNLMSRCVSALRGGSDTATDRVVQAAKLALSEILSRHKSNPTLVAAGTGLGDAVDAYEYASWLAQKESASGNSPVEGPSLPELVSGPNTDEDDVMRTGHGPGGEEAEPSLGEEGTSQKRSPALSHLRMETPPKRHPGKRRAVVREDESDDEETFDAGLNHLVSLSRAAEVEGSLMKDVPNTHLAFLLEQIALSCQALTELRSSAEPRRKRRNDTAEEMTATPTMVNEVADQVRVLRGVIDKRRGMGVHREVQEATKKLEAVLEGERRRKPSSRVGVHQAPPDERAMLGRVEKVPTKEAGTQTEHPEAAVSVGELSTGVAASNTLGESAPDGDLPPTAKVVKRVRKRRRKKANGRNDGEAGVAPQSQTAVAAGVPGLPSQNVVAPAVPPQDTWSDVVRHKAPNWSAKPHPNPEPPVSVRRPVIKAKAPRTEAVVIGPLKEDQKYSVVVKRVMEGVDLQALGVVVSGTRRTKTGAVLLEVTGTGAQADLLAAKVSEALDGMDVRVHSPVMSAAFMLLDVEKWIVEEDVVGALTTILSKEGVGVSVGAVSVRLHGSGKGRYTWCEVSIRASQPLVGLTRLRVGWGTCRIRVPQDKGPRCYRCLERGHVQTACNGVDRTGACFTCRAAGHRARDCPKKVGGKERPT
ncbi:uncharacterized protein LOC126895562 [Daktulosphaira vitifoliae]|uniref:uncharacterized protein LOC126895562 n=1 Tax=Daktulosphaira vitifoliae TaxID=58002 RepID=UPI0021AAD143|nr:uncharacterized protein LOC126895562 [Daktulosphaira vitifoliae]XP_050523513.1 uncharacterized protein LOC126895562 [Daktulosphaira vitifoliae]